MKWEKAEKKQNAYVIPSNWLFLEYYEALTILFRIENALRIFVYIVLKNEFQDKWTDANITSDDSTRATIGSLSKTRISQAKTFGYLGCNITCQIMHLTSGELIRLITDDSYWKYFNKFFTGSRDIMKNKLNEIGAIRNCLAHFRPVTEDDLEVIKQNAKQVLTRIEISISEMTRCRDIVPTNTNDDWYKELRTIRTEHFELSFNQSVDKQWVKITLEFKCPILYKKIYRSGQSKVVRVLNVISSSILKRHPILKKNVIYISEDVPYLVQQKDSEEEITKRVQFMLSRNTLINQYKDIKDEFENIGSEISKEIDLIKGDNLARGEMVEIARLEADLCNVIGEKEANGEFYFYNEKGLRTSIKDDDPSEYWGDFDFFDLDFISGTNIYPWMPVSISGILALDDRSAR